MAQLTLSSPTPLGTRRRPRDGSRVVRHQVMALDGVLRAVDILGVPLAGLIAYYLRFRSLGVEFQHGLMIILGMVVVANVMMVMDAYNIADRKKSIPCHQGGRRLGREHRRSPGHRLFQQDRRSVFTPLDRLLVRPRHELSGAARFAVAAYIGRRRRAGQPVDQCRDRRREPFAQQVMRQITWPGEIEVRVVGIFAPRVAAAGTGFAADATVEGLLRLARKTHIDEIIVYLPEKRDAEFGAVLRKLGELPFNVNLCPDLSDLPIAPRKLTVLQQTFMINVFEQPLAGWAAVLKRAEDIVLSGLLLLMFLPLMLLIALAVKLDSHGPVFFRQPRFGFNNNPITVLKFRTMVADAASDPTGEAGAAQRSAG